MGEIGWMGNSFSMFSSLCPQHLPGVLCGYSDYRETEGFAEGAGWFENAPFVKLT